MRIIALCQPEQKFDFFTKDEDNKQQHNSGTFYIYEIVPGNSEAECRNQCASSSNPAACEAFCDCIYNEGKSLDSCLANYNKAKNVHKPDEK